MAIDRKDPEVLELIEEVTAALSAKNAELLREVKTAKAKARGADIDPADHAALQSQVEELESKLRTTEGKLKADTDRLTKTANDASTSFTKYLIDAEIGSAIAKSGADAKYFDAVKALHGGKATVRSENGVHTVLIGDKPVAEHLTQWVASDSGAPYRAAAVNTGGGAAGGSKGQGAGKFSEMTSEAKTALFRTDPAAYEAAKKAG